MQPDVATLIRHAIPASQIAEVVPRAGQSNTVFEVRRVAAPTVIVKFYRPEWPWRQAKEIHVYRLLASTLPGTIPEVIHVQPPGETEAFTVLTKLDGVPLRDTTPPDPRAVYARLGEILAMIHSIRLPAYGYLTDRILDPLPTNAQYMNSQFAKKLAEFDELGGDEGLKQQIAEYVDEHRQLFDSSDTPRLVHNDFHEGNVLIDPRTWRIKGFVDVENALAADPLMDLAKTQYYETRDHPGKLAGLVEGYGELPDGWRERTRIYHLYHALELWNWFRLVGVVEPLGGITADLWTVVGEEGS